MADETSPPTTRAVDLVIEIKSSPEAVWKAITEPDELIRWFSPEASGEAKEGGHVTVSWGGGSAWKSNIVVWKPGVHLGLQDELNQPVEEQGAVVALDYFIETKDGSTVVRLVNSGFSADDEWDDFFHMVTNGWTFFLWNLKHYLERHPGTPRTMMPVRPWVSGTRDEVWAKVFGDEGLGDGAPASGQAFAFDLGSEVLEGVVVLSDRPWAFAGQVHSLDDGVIHIELEGSGDRWKLGVWLAAYGVDQDSCDRARSALASRIAGLFPQDEAKPETQS
ncbi:MAG: SRPBCC family protein [Longimicrobiales bacterium]